MSNVIIRFSPPIFTTKSSYGTICYEIVDEVNQRIYKQISHDTEHPEWKLIRDMHNALYSVYVDL